MADIMQSSRDPYPFPRFQNDDDFTAVNRNTQKHLYDQPTHVAQTQGPWHRLNSACTLASSRREVYHFDPLAPRDSLDFVLKTKYDHHNSFLATKPETVIQPETVGVLHGRVLKNRKQDQRKYAISTGAFDPYTSHVVSDPKKVTIDSFKGAIESHHSAATNPGYSRKQDGGFYTT